MSDDKAAEDRREYRWNLMAAIILSLATLASAWCGFQASSWNSVYSTESRTANGARLESGRQSDIADRQLSSDLLIFTAWLQAEINGQTTVAHEVELRFRDHFRPAFEAWRAQPVTAGGHLPEGTPSNERSTSCPPRLPRRTRPPAPPRPSTPPTSRARPAAGTC